MTEPFDTLSPGAQVALVSALALILVAAFGAFLYVLTHDSQGRSRRERRRLDQDSAGIDHHDHDPGGGA